jgi:hypothetical protein
MSAVAICAGPPHSTRCSLAVRHRWLRASVVALATGLALGAAPTRAEEAAFSLQYAQVAPAEPARLVVPPVLTAQAASSAQLDIRIGSSSVLPHNSYLRVRGLPPSVSLSDGHAITAGAWAVPLTALPNLLLQIPVGVSGRSELTVSLVNMDGDLLAEARMALVVTSQGAPPGASAIAPPAPPQPSDIPTPLPAARPKSTGPAGPILTPEERERAEKLTTRGERELAEGNIATARNFFLRAAEAGLARGALLLAATYDPRELTRMRAQGIQPNPAEARKWYERARELGAPEASERLSRLGGS